MDESIYTSIARKLSGEGTTADNAAIEKWLAEGPANEDIYKKLKAAWSNTDNIFETAMFDSSKAWEKVATKIQSTPLQQPRSVIFPAWAKYAVAAAAVLLIGFFVFRLQGNDMITVTASAENQIVTLPDNSKITLRKGSALHYPKHFEEKQRNVSLEGEAFFEVARNEQSPFVIDAQSASVKVLGTSFNVKCNKQTASVVVRTGKVQMKSNANDEYLILTPGEKGSLKNGSLTEETVSAANYLYWQTGVMDFNNVPFKSVVQQLDEITDSNIMLSKNMPVDVQLQAVNISFHNQSVEEILNDICLITQTSWLKNDSAYIINVK